MLHIRVARPDELSLLKAMTAEGFTGVSIDHGIEREFGPINGHDWRWRKVRHLDDDVRRDPDGVFVAELDGEVVGYVTSWCDREAGIGHIPNLVVRADQRGHGLGRRLLLHVLDHFRAQGLTHAKIETLAQNEVGHGLYTSLGFREVARQFHFAMELRGGFRGVL
jgi:ribosomal protein S18 acetylase RimI-like enzyme